MRYSSPLSLLSLGWILLLTTAAAADPTIANNIRGGNRGNDDHESMKNATFTSQASSTTTTTDTPPSSSSVSRKRRLRVGGVNDTPSRAGIIGSIALQGGAEFDDENSYQSRALRYVEETRGLRWNDRDFVVYYALACIYYASFGQPNKWLIQEYGPNAQFGGWSRSRHWMSRSIDKCRWEGIDCNPYTGTIDELKLFSNNMNGIFAPEVQFLSHTLRVLDLFNNPFLATEGDAGNSWLGEMTNLRELSVGSTSFEYPGIPPYINQMDEIVRLDLSNSRFQNGPLLGNAFRGLQHLESLDLSANTFTTNVPVQITRLPMLKYLYLDSVTFQTPFRQDLSFLLDMPSIFEVFLDDVPIRGGIPNNIGQVTTLASLSLTNCNLNGPLPRSLGNLVNLQRLWLYQNSLHGVIPTELNNLPSLQVLRVEGNVLNGQVGLCNSNSQAPLRLLGSDCGRTVCPCCTCCSVQDCATSQG